MPLQNRVLPTGEIVAHPARGLFMGNRGRLHDDTRRLVRQTSGQRAWICCLLAFKGRRRDLMAPRSYTELFFLDEAVALAAGHRPCAECRRSSFRAFQEAWDLAHGWRPKASEMDAALAKARRDRVGRQIVHVARLCDLPTGTFVATTDGALALVAGSVLLAYTPGGYNHVIRFGTSDAVAVLTPQPIVGVLRHYEPVLHPTAQHLLSNR